MSSTKPLSLGLGGVLGAEVKDAFCNEKDAPLVKDYIAGIGGKELNREVIKNIYADAKTITRENLLNREILYVGLNKQYVE